MIRDLTTGSAERTADVAIIGAGIAGLCLADRLRRHGKRVILLESGGARPSRDVDHPLNEVEVVGSDYTGATEGRARGLGGTSVKWGGALLPLLPADFDSDTAYWNINWPIGYAEIAPYLREAELVFGLGSARADEISPTAPDFIARSAKWPNFEKRNVANLFGRNIREAELLEVWVNATVTRAEFRQDGRLTLIAARSDNGCELSVLADEVVIAAGGIESTRLALLFDRANAGKLFSPRSPAGRFFHEHLSAHCATVTVRDRRGLARLAGSASGRTACATCASN